MLICLILSLRLKFKIIYEDELKCYLKILFFKIDLLSADTSKIDLKKLTDKIGDKGDTSKSDSENTPDDEVSFSIVGKLNSVRDILSVLFNTFRKHLHIKLTKIHVRVATEDAAKTAILYGAVSTAIACIVDIIDDITNLDKLKSSSISVEPDFLSHKTDIKLSILLSISLFGIIKVFMKSFLKYFSLNDKIQINNRKEN